MQKSYSNKFIIFAIELSCTFAVIVLLTMTFAAAEDFETRGHLLSDIELAIYSPLAGEQTYLSQVTALMAIG